jgi:hypothetical protein
MASRTMSGAAAQMLVRVEVRVAVVLCMVDALLSARCGRPANPGPVRTGAGIARLGWTDPRTLAVVTFPERYACESFTILE